MGNHSFYKVTIILRGQTPYDRQLLYVLFYGLDFEFWAEADAQKYLQAKFLTSYHDHDAEIIYIEKSQLPYFHSVVNIS